MSDFYPIACTSKQHGTCLLGEVATAHATVGNDAGVDEVVFECS